MKGPQTVGWTSGAFTLWILAAVGCVGPADEQVGAAIDEAPTSCEAMAEAVATGAREPDVTGERALDAVSEWSDVQATWDSLQHGQDVDEWQAPLTDRLGASLEPWVRIEMSDTVGHAWLEVCAYYEGPADSACFVGSTPATRPAPAEGQSPLPGCCRTTDEYGGAEVWLDVGSAWGDDSGTLHVSVRSPDATCAGYWLMVAGAAPSS